MTGIEPENYSERKVDIHSVTVDLSYSALHEA